MKKSELKQIIRDEINEYISGGMKAYWKKEAEKYIPDPNAVSQGYKEPNPFPKGSYQYWEREAMNTLNEPRVRDKARTQAYKLRPDIDLEENKNN